MIFGFHTREARIEGRRTLDKIQRGPYRTNLMSEADLLEEHLRAVRQMATRAHHLARLAALTEPVAFKRALEVG